VTITKLDPGVIEGQTLNDDVDASVDVVIVGSGAGGAVTADVLSAAGLQVVVLDEGGYFTSDRFRMREDEAFTHLYMEAGARVSKDQSVAILQGRAVGGTTVVNWTTSYRTPDDVIEHWQKKHAVSGVTHEDLKPHFESVEKRLNIHQVAEASLNRNNKLLYDGCKALGYEAHTLRRNVRGCAQTGYCGAGCPVDAKQSMTLTYLPDAMARGATVISRCRVDRVDHQAGEARAVRGTFLDALGREPTGKKISLRAKTIVLAAGGVGTPAILLRSGAPDPHGRTGARTFLHPNIGSIAELDEPVNPFYGAPQSAASHEFAHRADEVGYFLETIPVHPVLASVYNPGFGDDNFELTKRLPYLAIHIALAIDGFHDDVTGGQVRLHADGAPVLDYTAAPKVRAAFRHAQKTLARIQLAAGAKTVWTTHERRAFMKSEADLKKIDDLSFDNGAFLIGCAHVMGGSAMGDDPKTAVVRSEDLRHHQLKNLYVMDGSVFPTSLGVNPAESIYGLCRLQATRLAASLT
jgi:choline dehydrogenase-like flavoprotein